MPATSRATNNERYFLDTAVRTVITLDANGALVFSNDVYATTHNGVFRLLHGYMEQYGNSC